MLMMLKKSLLFLNTMFYIDLSQKLHFLCIVKMSINHYPFIFIEEIFLSTYYVRPKLKIKPLSYANESQS